MSMEEKISAIESVFRKLDDEIALFQSSSTLHCKMGCGKCCFKPDIEATILEFLPFAYHLYKNGLADEWYEKLKNNDSSICLILNPTQSGALTVASSAGSLDTPPAPISMGRPNW
jgi:uncharacterized protein